MNDLETHIHEREPDVMVITEVIPKAQSSAIPRVCLHVDGYSEYLNFDCGLCGEVQQGRGIAVYVKKSLSAYEVKTEVDYRDQLWLKIQVDKQDYMLLGAIYRSPSQSLSETVPILNAMMKAASETNPPYLIICGDFNIKGIDWKNERCLPGVSVEVESFLQGVQDSLLFQHVLEPTRFRLHQDAQILDLVFSNENFVQDVQYLPGLGLSDHLTVHFSVTCKKQESQGSRLYRDWKHVDFCHLNKKLSSYNLEQEISCQSVEEAWVTISEALNAVVEAQVPLRKCKKKLKPYMNKEALQLRRKKERLWEKYRLSGHVIDQRRFAHVRNCLRTLTRKLRIDHERRVAKSCKDNIKAFWNYVNRNMKLKPAVESLKLSNGEYASSDKEKCDALSTFFQSVYTTEKLDNVPRLEPRPYKQVLDRVVISEEDVKSRLCNLKCGKAPGIDGLHPDLLRGCASSLCGPLKVLFQKSFDSGELPSAWKKAVIKPIFKKGSRHELGNYRPVSLTSIVSKIMESIMKKEIMDHLLSQGLLSECQFGFIPGRSCESQMLFCLDKWSEYLDKGQAVDIIYTDFRKAFDAVPHQRLLNKLEAYGLGPKVVDWTRAFLCGRLQCVSINGSMSSWNKVTSGIPQGTVMGPLCFLLYINDLPDVVKTSSMCLFADDAKVFSPMTSDQQHHNLQKDLDGIMAWTERWQLPLNLSKCSAMHLGSNNPRHRYSLGKSQIKETLSERDLGIQVDNMLKFHDHAATVVKKCKYLMSVIKRSFKCLDKKMMTKLYKSLIRPVLEYGNSVWGPCFKGDEEKIEKIQRRLTKMIRGLTHVPYEERLKQLGLPSLRYRRLRGDMITIFKLVTGKLNVDLSSLQIERGPHRTRGHSLRIKKIRVVKQVRRNHLTIRAVNIWNSLPETVVNAGTVTLFKNRLDKFLKDKMYEVD